MKLIEALKAIHIVRPEIKCAAIEKDGEVWGYSSKPKQCDTGWQMTLGAVLQITCPIEYEGDWKDSLVTIDEEPATKKMYKCPYDDGIMCDMEDGCNWCEDFKPVLADEEPTMDDVDTMVEVSNHEDFTGSVERVLCTILPNNDAKYVCYSSGNVRVVSTGFHFWEYARRIQR